MSDDDRYTRQRRLREIGDAGQERLHRANVVVGGGSGALFELVYLHRAGVGSVTIDAFAAPRAFAHESAFRHEASRRHAAASWRALKTLVEVVGAAPEASPARGAAS